VVLVALVALVVAVGMKMAKGAPVVAVGMEMAREMMAGATRGGTVLRVQMEGLVAMVRALVPMAMAMAMAEETAMAEAEETAVMVVMIVMVRTVVAAVVAAMVATVMAAAMVPAADAGDEAAEEVVGTAPMLMGRVGASETEVLWVGMAPVETAGMGLARVKMTAEIATALAWAETVEDMVAMGGAGGVLVEMLTEAWAVVETGVMVLEVMDSMVMAETTDVAKGSQADMDMVQPIRSLTAAMVRVQMALGTWAVLGPGAQPPGLSVDCTAPAARTATMASASAATAPTGKATVNPCTQHSWGLPSC
jgi:hypothetical protein